MSKDIELEKLEKLKKFLGLELNKPYTNEELTNIINTPNQAGYTPLHQAIDKSNSELVKLLLEYGAKDSINTPTQDRKENTPLIMATTSNSEIVKLLLENGAQASINTQDKWGYTPLHYATYTSNSEIVKLLLENGAQASINTQDRLGDTPLHYAVYKNNSELVKLLLANGAKASINTPNQAGDTPLHQAIDNSNSELVKLLLENGAKDSINTQNQWGNTPLIKAIYKNNSELVKLLLEYGAKDSINTPNQAGDTPLLKAIDKSNSEIVKLLLENGAKASINTPNQARYTPLHQAIDKSNSELVKLLLEYGAKDSINTQNQAGNTPLFEAISRNSPEILKLLLQYETKDSINIADQYGSTHLYWAADRGHVEIVKLLLENGVKMDANSSEFLNNDKIISLPNDIKYKIADMVYCYRNEIQPDSDASALDRINNLIETFKLKDEDLAEQMLYIAFANISLLNINLFFQIPAIQALINENPKVLESKLNGMLTEENVKAIFTHEFREFYNLPKFIKFNHKDSEKLNNKFDKLHNKYHTTLDNFNILKNGVPKDSDMGKKFEGLERDYLSFKEEEAVELILRLLAPENSVSPENPINPVASKSGSDNKLKDVRSLYEDDEKEPNQAQAKNNNQPNRAEKIVDIAFDYIDILNMNLFLQIQEVQALISQDTSILPRLVEKMLSSAGFIENLKTKNNANANAKIIENCNLLKKQFNISAFKEFEETYPGLINKEAAISFSIPVAEQESDSTEIIFANSDKNIELAGDDNTGVSDF